MPAREPSSFWLYGRSHESPRSAAFALFEGFESDWCLENMIKMLSIMWSGGCINTTGIENPGSGTLWPMVRALMEEHGLDGRLVYTVVHYCMYGAPYRKRTRIWTNCAWTPRPPCIHKCHAMSAQKGPRRRAGQLVQGDNGSLQTLHALPAALTEELFLYCTNEEQV